MKFFRYLNLAYYFNKVKKNKEDRIFLHDERGKVQVYFPIGVHSEFIFSIFRVGGEIYKNIGFDEEDFSYAFSLSLVPMKKNKIAEIPRIVYRKEFNHSFISFGIYLNATRGIAGI